MSNISILCWNISNPSIERATKQAEWLNTRSESVFVLTETKSSKGCAFMENYFRSYGYNVVSTKPIDKNYAVMIVSKLDLKPTVFSQSMNFLSSRLASVEININNIKIEIIGIYIPSRNASEQKILRKKTFINKLIKVFDNSPYKGERLVCGDFNILEPNHIPYYSFFKQWEYDFYSILRNYNLIDAFRHLNPTKNEYSWIGRTGDGYRYDHCFVSNNLVRSLSKSYYLHSPRTNKLSDHAAIITELQFNP